MSHRRLHNLRAFTLVELLVVIGIIAVLIAILLPTLVGARRSAAAVKCAAQLRDLGNAIQIYSNESGGYVPTVQSTYSSAWRPMWYDQLAKYVFKSGVPSGSPLTVINDINFPRTTFAGCPAFEFTLYTSNPNRSGTGYGMNLIPVPLPPPAVSVINQFTTPALTKSSTPPQRYFKFVEFKNPANRALMADANGYNGIRANDPDPVSVYTKPNGNNAAGDVDYYRHSRLFDLSKPGCNVLFADLHVEQCTPWATFWAIRDPARRANGI